jgi:hypothetical protein
MPDSLPPTSPQPKQRSSRLLVYVMLGIIILFIAAFLIFHPDPTGAGHSKTNTTSDH